MGLSTEQERLGVRTGQGLGLLSAVGYTNQVCGTVRDTRVQLAAQGSCRSFLPSEHL